MWSTLHTTYILKARRVYLLSAGLDISSCLQSRSVYVSLSSDIIILMHMCFMYFASVLGILKCLIRIVFTALNT